MSLLIMHSMFIYMIVFIVFIIIADLVSKWMKTKTVNQVETMKSLNEEITELRQQRWAQEVNGRIEALMQAVPQPDGSDVPWNIALRAAQDIIEGEEPRNLYMFPLSEEDYDKGMNKNG